MFLWKITATGPHGGIYKGSTEDKRERDGKNGKLPGAKSEYQKEDREMNGQILKVKTGYNPNSSSIGVDVIAFFTAGAAMTVLFNTLAAVLSAANVQEQKKPEEFDEIPALGQSEKRGRAS